MATAQAVRLRTVTAIEIEIMTTVLVTDTDREVDLAMTNRAMALWIAAHLITVITVAQALVKISEDMEIKENGAVMVQTKTEDVMVRIKIEDATSLAVAIAIVI